MAQRLKLGLFGQGIGKSLSPFLQEAIGSMLGFDASYQLFETPAEELLSIPIALQQLKASGYSGVNITHPFKEHATAWVSIDDPNIRRIGSINTIRLSDMQGFNTDYSGFVRGYLRVFGNSAAGTVLMIGAGGVGKAVAYGLLKLQASELIIIDTNLAKARDLAEQLSQAGLITRAFSPEHIPQLAPTNGLINCTPIGMYPYPGLPLPAEYIGGQKWVFEAVYSPLETEFLKHAKAQNLNILNGAELLFYQAIDAFEIWTGTAPTPTQQQELYTMLHQKFSEREEKRIQHIP